MRVGIRGRNRVVPVPAFLALSSVALVAAAKL
jgi:hypothetical protein